MSDNVFYFACLYCGYKTTNKEDLHMHVMAKHQPKSEVVAYCRFCARVAPEWTNEQGEVMTTHCKECGAQLSCVAREKIATLNDAVRIMNPITPHYYKGRDVMDIINRYELGFCLGQVVKYVLRARHKNGVVDLRKAMWYLKEEIETVDKGISKL